jgi:hypothetical protein
MRPLERAGVRIAEGPRPVRSKKGTTPMNNLRFTVPGVAAEAVNVRQLERRARTAGVRFAQFAYQFAYRDSGDGNAYRCRVTCSGQMAVFLIEQLRLAEADATQREDIQLASTCARGIRETFAALMAPGRPSRTDVPADRQPGISKRRGIGR